MVRALALKELRETAWIALVAIAIHGYLVAEAMNFRLLPWQRGYGQYGYGLQEGMMIPFFRSTFLMNFGWVSAGLAIGLAFRQSAWESGQGTFLFLLHRPYARRAIFAVKLATGLVLLLATSALPILVYGLWAATPGTHPSPFEWSMTAGVWKLWLATPAVYLGAFLAGIRPARWFGSRLFPLVPALLVVPLVSGLRLVWVGAAISLVVAAIDVVGIMHVVRTRNYS